VQLDSSPCCRAPVPAAAAASRAPRQQHLNLLADSNSATRFPSSINRRDRKGLQIGGTPCAGSRPGRTGLGAQAATTGSAAMQHFALHRLGGAPSELWPILKRHEASGSTAAATRAGRDCATGYSDWSRPLFRSAALGSHHLSWGPRCGLRPGRQRRGGRWIWVSEISRWQPRRWLNLKTLSASGRIRRTQGPDQAPESACEQRFGWNSAGD